MKKSPLKRKTPLKRVAFLSTRKIVGDKKVKTKPQKISFLAKPRKKPSVRTIRIDPLDILVSEYVRKRTNGFCQRCGTWHGWNKLQACHFHSRRKISVRYDPDNLAACCYGCHSWIDGNPLEKIQFFKELLGEEAFDLLNSRARIPSKYIDKNAIKIYYQQKIKEITKDFWNE